MEFWPIVFYAAAAYNAVIGAGSLLQPGAPREGRVIGSLVVAFDIADGAGRVEYSIAPVVDTE